MRSRSISLTFGVFIKYFLGISFHTLQTFRVFHLNISGIYGRTLYSNLK